MNTKNEFHHAKIGAEILDLRLRDLSFSNHDREYIVNLVKHHHESFIFSESLKNLSKKSNIKHIKHFLSETDKDFVLLRDLIDLSVCDKIGTGTRNKKEVLTWYKELLKVINNIEENENALTLKDLKID